MVSSFYPVEEEIAIDILAVLVKPQCELVYEALYLNSKQFKEVSLLGQCVEEAMDFGKHVSLLDPYACFLSNGA